MRNSTFVRVLFGALVLGVAYGAVFAVGMEVGRSQGGTVAADTTEEAGASLLPGLDEIPASIDFTAEDVEALRTNLEARFGGEIPEGIQTMLDAGYRGPWWTIDLCFWPEAWEELEPSLDFVRNLLKDHNLL